MHTDMNPLYASMVGDALDGLMKILFLAFFCLIALGVVLSKVMPAQSKGKIAAHGVEALLKGFFKR